jgi:heme/copper-type cytochrome/quinol oxidase subunit 2
VHFQQVFGRVFSLQTTIAEVVFGLVVALMVAAMVISWLRRRRKRPAARRSEANPLEIGYALALVGMIVYLVMLSFSANASFWRDPPAALHVRVTAFQWCWRFQYAGQPVSIRGSCAGGAVPTLVLPAGEPVRVDLASSDVIHAFWVPALKFKMDIYPGHVNSFTFTLRDGRWIGRCTQFCGLYHYGMMFYLQAVPREQFYRWLHARAHPAAVRGAA